MEEWKNSPTPWREIVEMGNLTNLIYDYAKHWTIDHLGDLSSFFEENAENEHLGDNDKATLLRLKEKYPEGKILKFFTNSADLQCVVGENPHKKRFTLVFRGSEGIWDWLYDLLIIKIGIGDGVSVHRGFYKQLTHNNTFDRMKTFIHTCIVRHPDWEWFVSGHSLGAAQSTLAAYLLSRIYEEQKFTVVSLASPRVGNRKFRDNFNNQPNLRHYRVCNGRDCVTSMPMWNYCHVGKNLYYDSNKSEWYDYGFVPPFSYYLYNFWNPYDHSCGLYVKFLMEKKLDEIIESVIEDEKNDDHDENSNKKVSETQVVSV